MPKSSKNIRQEVARLLERAILTGRIKPGMRLPAEIKIARELGISQASVREALVDLEGQGLIVKNRNSSTHVVELTTDDLASIHQLRLELEPMACAAAARHLTADTLRQLEHYIAVMRSSSQCEDYEAFIHADLAFHRLIWSSQPNRLLEKCLLTVCLPLFAYDLVCRYPDAALNFERSHRQHELLVSALRLKDPDRVFRLSRRLVDRWMRQELRDFTHIQKYMPFEATEDPLEVLRDLLAEDKKRRT